jgi:quercetin dioxygenase-like cupin family protein
LRSTPQLHVLEVGDAILLEADVPHQYRNAGQSEALTFLLMTYGDPIG